MQKLKVALAQMTSGESLEENLAQVLRLLGEIPDPSLVDLAVFPENTLYLRVGRGSSVPGLRLDEGIFRSLQEFVDRHQLTTLLGSIPLREDNGRLTNAMVCLAPGQPAEVLYRKIHLFDVDVPGAPAVRESEHFQHGGAPKVWPFKGWKFGLSICYDVRFAELYSQYAKQEAHVLLVPSAFLVPTGEAHWHILLRARAIENQCFVLAPAQAGEHVGKSGAKRRTYGHTLAVDPWGRVMADMGTAGPRIEVVTLDPERIREVRAQIPMAGHRRLL